jgi:microcompartment protein CcmK/EutM
MKRGVVVGELWVTKQAPGLLGKSLKLIAQPAQQVSDGDAASRTLNELAESQLVVAVDTLDARNGQTVLLAYGSGARNVVVADGSSNRFELCDAAVAVLVDGDSSGALDSEIAPQVVMLTAQELSR